MNPSTFIAIENSTVSGDPSTSSPSSSSSSSTNYKQQKNTDFWIVQIANGAPFSIKELQIVFEATLRTKWRSYKIEEIVSFKFHLLTYLPNSINDFIKIKKNFFKDVKNKRLIMGFPFQINGGTIVKQLNEMTRNKFGRYLTLTRARYVSSTVQNEFKNIMEKMKSKCRLATHNLLIN